MTLCTATAVPVFWITRDCTSKADPEVALHSPLSGNARTGNKSGGLGYSTPSAFTFTFRRKMGCSPSEWRRKRLLSGVLGEICK
jgi:hypothetical protein